METYYIRQDSTRGKITIRIYKDPGDPIEAALGRQCLTCKVVQTREAMGANSSSRDGMPTICKECNKSRTRMHLADPDHRKQKAESSAAWKRANPEKSRELSRIWKKLNPEKTRAYSNKQRQLKRLADQGYMDIDWQQAQQYFGYVCPLSDQSDQVSMEHFIPLSLGGVHSRSNVVPMSRSLNSSKGRRNPFDWINTQPAEYRDGFNRVVAYLADQNEMSVAEYKEYVDSFFAQRSVVS